MDAGRGLEAAHWRGGEDDGQWLGLLRLILKEVILEVAMSV